MEIETKYVRRRDFEYYTHQVSYYNYIFHTSLSTYEVLPSRFLARVLPTNQQENTVIITNTKLQTCPFTMIVHKYSVYQLLIDYTSTT